MKGTFTTKSGLVVLTEYEVSRREIAWYRQNGRHSDRVNKRDGRQWLTGDWSWNRLYPKRFEEVEADMRRAGIYEIIK